MLKFIKMKLKRKFNSVDKNSTKSSRKRKKLEDAKTPRKKIKVDDEDEDGEEENVSFDDELAQLAIDDPPLYEFLKQEERDLFDKDGDNDSEELNEEEKYGPELNEEEQDSDKEEYEVDEEIKNMQKIFSLPGIKSHKIELQTDPTTGRQLVSNELLSLLDEVLSNPSAYKKALPRATDTAIKAFIACVAYVGGASISKLTQNGQMDFVVHKSKVFDQVLQLTFKTLGNSLYHLLDPVEKIKNSKKQKSSFVEQKQQREHFRHWHRYRALAKNYFEALNIFLLELRSNDVVVRAIKAVTELTGLYLHFPKLSKNLIKCLVRIWSEQHVEEARCIAFVALSKMARIDIEVFPIIYKSCYVAYISNCKLVDEETLPAINFMKRSFIELTFVHSSIAYQYAFVYIRQFAIHLRNAMIAKRKELVQTVYNWQFIKGLEVWTELIGEGVNRFPPSKNGEENKWFRELAHPLVEIISITERLSLSSKYLPLRIHCIRMLLSIQRECNIFIPTLASSIELLDELTQMDSKKPQTGKGVVKGILLDKMLRLSCEMHDNWGVRLYLAQQLADLIIDALQLLKTQELEYRCLLMPIGVKIRHFLKAINNREFAQLFMPIKKQISADADED